MTRICEVISENGALTTRDIFRFKPSIAEQGTDNQAQRLNSSGQHALYNDAPQCLSILKDRGFQIPAELEGIISFASDEVVYE